MVKNILSPNITSPFSLCCPNTWQLPRPNWWLQQWWKESLHLLPLSYLWLVRTPLCHRLELSFATLSARHWYSTNHLLPNDCQIIIGSWDNSTTNSFPKPTPCQKYFLSSLRRSNQRPSWRKQLIPLRLPQRGVHLIHLRQHQSHSLLLHQKCYHSNLPYCSTWRPKLTREGDARWHGGANATHGGLTVWWYKFEFSEGKGVLSSISK